jgi:CBS domain-containing protein
VARGTLWLVNTTLGVAKGSPPRHRTVADVMTTHVHVASPQAPFKVLVRLIEENKVGAIPIVDQHGIPIGIVSEADLLPGEGRLETVASQLMTLPAITVPADTPLRAAAQLMQRKNIGRLIVVDHRGRIAGIVSRSNLLLVRVP